MDELPELYSILRGEVASVMEYGAFIKIPGCRKQGLVHRTHMSSCRVDNPSEIVDVGEKVWVKVIGKEVQDEKVKLSFSMKVVNQGTGKDLDPNNVGLEQDERRRREFRDYSKQRITLEAVLNTTCKKCGCKGHFTKDCFSQPGGLQYSLLPEEEEEQTGEGFQEQPSQSGKDPTKRKKEKKTKKKKKMKKKLQEQLHSSSGSDSDDGSDSSSDEDDPRPTKRRRSSSKKHRRSSSSSEQKKKKSKKHKKQKHKAHRKHD
uniref:Zinc finger CCHC domain-containing protein 17 n=1 Tax=Lepisosteus oculatus TaxID=7918 RepID=W5MDA2_LEPOC|nr:PREDICTED: nucleolar protein of 40 kDa isoform X1 [Lepisosteus oculatus]XP_015204193.1 PREDICTED: nucleolar protein of 40 kDa isoform X1 [Lepisosteus oculatus]